MAAREYVATKTQNEVMNGELILEKIHVEQNLEEEMMELDGLLIQIGIPLEKKPAKENKNKGRHSPLCVEKEYEDVEEGPTHPKSHQSHARMQEHANLRQQLKEFYRDNPDALLQIMQALEFGMVEEEGLSLTKAGLLSCILFIIGSLPSVLPFVFSEDRPNAGLIAPACITITVLTMVGPVKTWAAKGCVLLRLWKILSLQGLEEGLLMVLGLCLIV